MRLSLSNKDFLTQLDDAFIYDFVGKMKNKLNKGIMIGIRNRYVMCQRLLNHCNYPWSPYKNLFLTLLNLWPITKEFQILTKMQKQVGIFRFHIRRISLFRLFVTHLNIYSHPIQLTFRKCWHSKLLKISFNVLLYRYNVCKKEFADSNYDVGRRYFSTHIWELANEQ